MIEMYHIAEFITDTLSQSTEYKDYVQSVVDAEFLYVEYADMNDMLQTEFPPNYVSVATYENIDETGNEFSFKTALLITIKKLEMEETGRILRDPTFKKLNLVSSKARDILKEEMALYGINRDTNIKIEDFNMFTPTPMGEEGLQMQIDIKMSKDLSICSSN